MNSLPNSPDTLSVADFIAKVNATVTRLGGRIEGEVTSVKKTYATAVYFSIKDLKRDAILNCIIWRTTYNQNGVDIEEGDKVVVTGSPEIYAPRGTFSIKVQTIEYAGEGALKKAYDELRLKLDQEGLLNPSLKRPLPKFPKKIGVITSRSGVVIQDFNSNLGRYGFQTTMIDSRVEGKDAIHEILAALKTMARQDIDVLVVMRGGGSWESLQAFNTESVVRAIASSKCPVLTGIGHDVDVTLSELVADVGASTPTAVAEALNETWDTLVSSLDRAEASIFSSFNRSLSEQNRIVGDARESIFRKYDRSLNSLHRKLTVNSSAVLRYFKNIEQMITKVNVTFQKVLGTVREKTKTIHKSIEHYSSSVIKSQGLAFKHQQNLVADNGKRLSILQNNLIKESRHTLNTVEKNISRLDPSRNLRLGYSLSYLNGKLVRSKKDIKEGESIETKLEDGSFTSLVKKVI